MGWKRASAVILTTTALATAALGQPAQRVTGPVATYWMSAQTTSGFGMGAMGAGGPPGRGGVPNIRDMMGGGAAQHQLRLQLGSSTRPPGEPKAEHNPPATLRAGDALPLVSPQAAAGVSTDEAPQVPREMQRPQGRMLIFWGCGEHAPQGQPVIVDFAQLSSGGAAALQALSRGVALTPMQPPAPGRNATYGEWPNERARVMVPPEGSLVGPHLVHGDYSPDIRFVLSPTQDFLAPITLTTNAKTPSGAAQLGWNAVPRATGYFATAMGANGAPGGRGGQGADMVFWSSSANQVSAFFLPDYITPADAARLVAGRTLLDPQTTSCTVPKEVVDAAPQAMVQLAAYGDEANFSYPPRPENRATPWNIQWQVKVRYRSSTGGLLGMTMPSFGADQGAAPPRGGQPPQQQPPTQGRRPNAGDILRGLGLPGIPGR